MRRPNDVLPRFSRAELWVHRCTAFLVFVLAVTGSALYVEQLSLLIGRRVLVEGVHIVAGLLLPVPMLIGLFVSPALRADVRVLGRMSRLDWSWLRRRDRRAARLPVGKFNGGQKLAAAVMVGAALVLFGTGLLLIAPARINLPVDVRQGATITHDLFTFGFLVLVLGHLWLAYTHPEARTALRTGTVDRAYAEREYAGWAAGMRSRSDRR